MKRTNIISLMALLFALVITGCKEDSPLDGEQYLKQVYLVGSDQTTDEGLRTVDVPYKVGEPSEVSVSVATGGSLNIDRDVSVLLKEAGSEAIEDYNFKYVDDEDVKYQHLDGSSYEIPDFTVNIKAGDIYGLMPVEINTEGLNADSLYALTFQIASVSDPDYISIRQVDTVLILAFNFINDFSGSYQSSGYYYPWAEGEAAGDSVEVSTSRTLTALDANTVRLYHLSTVEDKSNLASSGLTLNLAPDNTVTVAAWADLVITDGGGSYDPETGIMNLWYNYMDGDKEYQFSGELMLDD